MMQSYTRTLRHHLCRGRRLVLGLILATLAIVLTIDTLYGTFIETTRSPYDYQHVTFVHVHQDHIRHAELAQATKNLRVEATGKQPKPTRVHTTSTTLSPTTTTVPTKAAGKVINNEQENQTGISKPPEKQVNNKNDTSIELSVQKSVQDNQSRITLSQKENYQNSENNILKGSTEKPKVNHFTKMETKPQLNITTSQNVLLIKNPTTLEYYKDVMTENTIKGNLEHINNTKMVHYTKDNQNTSFVVKDHIENSSHKNSSKEGVTTLQKTSRAKSALNTTESLSNNLKACMPITDTSDIKTPYKIYVYQLPSMYNQDIQKEMSTTKTFSYCYNLYSCGMGPELYAFGRNDSNAGKYKNSLQEVSIRDTHQFSLEVILHYKMLNSPYRTMDPNRADVFYIPAYTGLNCLMFKNNTQSLIQDLFTYLRKEESQHFLSGKPHVMALSKIQREQFSEHCPTLRHPDTGKITFVGIEKEANPFWVKSDNVWGKSIVVVPYPSYVHFIPHTNDFTLQEYGHGIKKLNETKFMLDVPKPDDRPVLLFLAASERRSNDFRAKILNQFTIRTDKGFNDFQKAYNKSNQTLPKQTMLKTSECSKDHRTTTIPWMRKSVFCLQPPGDSPTRKSIYDSILSGCIPILIRGKFTTEYPFETYLNYSTFTYSFEENLLLRYNVTVFDIVKDITPHKIEFLFANLQKVAKWFQYSLPDFTTRSTDDAFTLVLDEIGTRHGLHQKLNATWTSV